MARHEEPLLLPSQRRELDRRCEDMDRGNVSGLSWEEALKQIVKGRTGK